MPAIVALRGFLGASNAIVYLDAFHRLSRLMILPRPLRRHAIT
jgi:hypothetical protein